EGLDARIEELDLDLGIPDRTRLADQLVQARLGDRPLPVLGDIPTVGGARRLAVEAEAETNRRSARARPQDEMDVAGMEAEDDAPARRVELGALVPDRPIAGERPSIALQALGRRVDVPLVSHRAARRGEAVRARGADIRLGRFKVGPICRGL